MYFERDVSMKKEYDFSKAKKNPYYHRLKQQVSVNLDVEAVEYFKETAKKKGIPYQTLINLYLVDCAKKKLELKMSWD